MFEDKFVDDAISILLAKYGIRASRIPETKTKTPDLIIDDSSGRYLIEVKVKLDNAEEIQKRRKSLSTTGEYESVKNTEYQTAYNSVIDRAAKQLTEFDVKGDYFHIVWCEFTGITQDLMRLVFKNTFYGIGQICELDTLDGYEAIFFEHSSFYRNRYAIDGAIFSFENKCWMNLNPASPKAIDFKDSPLVKSFGEAVYDPIQLEINGQVLIADTDIPREDTVGVRTYLMNKYNLSQIISMNFKEFKAEIAVPRKENEPTSE